MADKLAGVPARAQEEVRRNLALLDTQLAEANQRLVTTRGQGGPNFVRNAILGPLADKRGATIDRIAIAIGRVAARPTNLGGLAECTLSDGGGQPPAAEPPAAEPPAAEPPAAEPPAAEPPAQGGARRIVCPTVADKLPGVPARAQAEVTANLALLENQLAEANNRLVTSAGQGGPNFVQNAILGPLEDKRFATINRIATAIGRAAARPSGLAEAHSACSLSG